MIIRMLTEISFRDYNMNMLNVLFYKKTVYMKKIIYIKNVCMLKKLMTT